MSVNNVDSVSEKVVLPVSRNANSLVQIVQPPTPMSVQNVSKGMSCQVQNVLKMPHVKIVQDAREDTFYQQVPFAKNVILLLWKGVWTVTARMPVPVSIVKKDTTWMMANAQNALHNVPIVKERISVIRHLLGIT